jgi:hypothetical protein
VHFKSPPPDAARRKEIAQAVLQQYEEMQRIEEWMGLMRRLRDATGTEGDDLDSVLKDLIANNTRWLSVTQAQFADEIAHLR